MPVLEPRYLVLSMSGMICHRNTSAARAHTQFNSTHLLNCQPQNRARMSHLEVPRRREHAEGPVGLARRGRHSRDSVRRREKHRVALRVGAAPHGLRARESDALALGAQYPTGQGRMCVGEAPDRVGGVQARGDLDGRAPGSALEHLDDDVVRVPGLERLVVAHLLDTVPARAVVDDHVADAPDVEVGAVRGGGAELVLAAGGDLDVAVERHHVVVRRRAAHHLGDLPGAVEVDEVGHACAATPRPSALARARTKRHMTRTRPTKHKMHGAKATDQCRRSPRPRTRAWC
eukprot:3149356-Rhodomonas_salina.3